MCFGCEKNSVLEIVSRYAEELFQGKSLEDLTRQEGVSREEILAKLEVLRKFNPEAYQQILEAIGQDTKTAESVWPCRFYCIGKIDFLLDTSVFSMIFPYTTRLIYLDTCNNCEAILHMWTSKALLSLTSNFLIEKLEYIIFVIRRIKSYKL